VKPCTGLSQLFFDPRRTHDAARVCDTCGCRYDCTLNAMHDMYTDDAGEPVAWLVHGGLTPRQQESLWRESLGGRDTEAVMEAVL